MIMRKVCRLILLSVAFGSVFAGLAMAQDSGAGEYEIKAAFLLNFARFAQWPPTALGDAPRPIVIGIVGEDPFDPQILDGLGRKSVDGRPLVIRHFKDGRDLDGCHILFVGAMKDKDLQAILEAASKKNILTVGDNAGFMSAGGMIRFLAKGDKIRFEVSPMRVESASIKLSAKLMGVAIIVRQ